MRPGPVVMMLAVLTAAAAVPAVAQTSAHYRLTESAFNSGGDPRDASYAASAHHRVTLDAIGDVALAATDPRSASHHLSSGLVAAYLPPGEVLRISIRMDRTTLDWTPEPSVGSYNLYRGTLAAIAPVFGSCLQSRIAGESWSDPASPSAGSGLFYLVTARNRLDEEGPKGYQGSGAERPNPEPCL